MDVSRKKADGEIFYHSSDHPLLAITVLSGIISIFKSYPTLGDASLWLGLLGCLPDIWAGQSPSGSITLTLRNADR